MRYDDTLVTENGDIQIHGLGADNEPLAKGALLADASGAVLPWPTPAR